MASINDSKEEPDDKNIQGRLMPDAPHHQMSSGRRSPSQYDDGSQQTQLNYLHPPRTTYVTTGDFQVASFTKPTPTTSYANPIVYVVSPPLSRSPPMPPSQTLPAMPQMSMFAGGGAQVSPSMEGQQNSFTNTFLRGILSSIDSKDPVVANAWLETLLDAIDLLPADVIKRELVVIAVNKAQIGQTANSRKAACRLIGKISYKLDSQTVRHELLPVAMALCQDTDFEVRLCMCYHLGFVAHGVGAEAVDVTVLPQLIDLGNDGNSEVRVAVLEAVVQLLGLLDKELCNHTVVPLIMKICEAAKHVQDETLPKISNLLGPLCHGLSPHLTPEQRNWFVNLYRHLARLGLSPSRESTMKKGLKSESQPMPDLLPSMEIDRAELYADCRYYCAFNLPAMVVFVGASNFVEVLHPIFADLSADPSWKVRQTVARCLHEVAKLAGVAFKATKLEVCNLFADSQLDVLEAMVVNMVHVIDALARHGVLQFAGQGGKYSYDLSRALLKCEETISTTRNWRLQADCLEKFSCLANCISPTTIMQKFIPMLFSRMQRTRTLPCRVAAARTLLVILRFTVKIEDRSRIIFRIQQDLANGHSCHTRMLFLKLCEMAISLFSRQYFKRNFFDTLLLLSKDRVPNVRLKLCGILSRLKSLLSLPSDRTLLQRLEETVKDLMVRETDTDVLFAIQKAIQDLDAVETGVDGVPSMNVDDDRENERKLREERLIASMEDKLYNKSPNSDVSGSPTKHYLPVSTGAERLRYLTPSPPASTSTSPLGDSGRRRSGSLPPPLLRGSTSNDHSSFSRQTPEPMRTYSSELSGYSSYLSEKRETAGNSNPWSSRNFSQQPYSSSLENLDPSAKEFLVDAGVVLDKSSIQSNVSSSLPNLSKIGAAYTGGKPDRDGSQLEQKKPTEGDFSKYLISNEEMELYEAEYQRCASALASGKTDPESLTSSGNSLYTRTISDSHISPTRSRESSFLPQADKIFNISTLAQNTFSKLASSDTLQGSIERLAEKWEAKRRSLSEDSNDDESEAGGQVHASEQSKLIAIKQQAVQSRRSLLKPPTGASLASSHTKLGPSSGGRTILAKKRLSLTDHVGVVSQQAMQKIINRKSLNSNDMIGYDAEEKGETSRPSRLKTLRRFASMDDSKDDADTNFGRQPNSYGQKAPNNYTRPRATLNNSSNDSKYFYNSPTHLPGNTGSRTLPQPPRSLPMTPGSNQITQRMTFIPSKPFNNLLGSGPHPSLSSSAPPSITSTSPRQTYPSHTLASSTSSTNYRGQPEARYTTAGAARRPVEANSKSRIVSPYIVAVDTSSTESGFLTPEDCPDSPGEHPLPVETPASKFSRINQPAARYRPPAPQSIQKRPVSATNSSSGVGRGGGSKLAAANQNGMKQQYGKSVSAESVLAIDHYDSPGTQYSRQPGGNYGSGMHRSSAGRDYLRKSADEPKTAGPPTANGMRKSSGARMWQGQPSTVRQRSQEGRSQASLPPPSTGTSGATRTRPQRQSSNDNYENVRSTTQPRSTYNGGTTSYQAKASSIRSRPSSIHSSPGSSRPGSPQNVPTNSATSKPPTRRPLMTRNNASQSASNIASRGNASQNRAANTHQNSYQRRAVNNTNAGSSQPIPPSGRGLTRQQSGGLLTPGFSSRVQSQRGLK